MSVQDLEKAFQLIEDEFTADEKFFSGPQDQSTIDSAEYALKVTLPSTYREFLKKYGYGGVNALEIYGLNGKEIFSRENIPDVAVPNAIWVTLQDNRDFQHPLYLIPIYDLGEGTKYCLDTSQMDEKGECPVVAWPIGGYEMTPKLEVIAEDFGEFFLMMVKEEIQQKKDEVQG